MAGGKEDDSYVDLPKRYGAPYSNKKPKNDLDSMLDFYLAHPTSAPIMLKENAADNIEYEPSEFSSYIDPSHTTLDPRGDVDPDSHADSSWARDRD